MKKLLTILLALLVVTGVVFAEGPGDAIVDSTAELVITATNEGNVEHKITAEEVKNYGDWTGNASITNEQEVGLNELAVQSVAWYSIMSNMTAKYDVTVSATPLHNGTDQVPGYKIPYTLSVGGVSKGFSGTHGTGDTVGTFTDIKLENLLGGTGLQFESKEITVQFSEDYTLSAEEGDYTATITFTIAAQ
jgi:hypothetical protein